MIHVSVAVDHIIELTGSHKRYAYFTHIYRYLLFFTTDSSCNPANQRTCTINAALIYSEVHLYSACERAVIMPLKQRV